ncbi:MAG: hypothetical protein MUP70_06480, partial [Candidatus Aminicenantes bacterium]|nr:hypothetical protein [Candidatus Aminicenantes bacterium]
MKRREFLQKQTALLAGIPLLLDSSSRKAVVSFSDYSSSETEDVKALVLGTAQDGGIPHMGCDCSNCRRAYSHPLFRRRINSLAVFDRLEKKTFIFDASPDIRSQLDLLRERSGLYNGEERSYPDAIFITHAHIGHYTGLMFYGYE